MANPHAHTIANSGRITQPIHLTGDDAAAQELVARAYHDCALLRTNRDDVHRMRITTGDSASLADGVAREPVVLADHGTARCDNRSARQRWSIGRQTLLQNSGVVTVGDEADLLALGF